MANNDVQHLLDMLYEMIDGAKNAPLTSDKCILNRDEALDLLDEIRAQLPVELSRAQELIRAKEDYVKAAKRDVERMMQQAEQDAKNKVSETEVLGIAREKSHEIIKKAEDRSREMYRVANEYTEDALRRTEEAIQMALEEGKATLSDTFYCKGYYNVAGWSRPIKCHKTTGHGTLDFSGALQQSCNPAMMMLAERIGATSFINYFCNFGLNEKTGVDLPGEGSSIYKESLSGVDLAVYSFGQRYNVTAIQQITAVAAVANGGNLVTPHLVKEIADDDGNILASFGTTVKRQVISASTSATISKILADGVSGNGGARNAYVAGYKVAAKTGTSEKGTGGGRIASTVAYAPADDPQVICIIIVDEPTIGSVYGSTVAAPYVSKVLSEVLPYLGIEPEYANGEMITLENLRGSSLDAAKSRLGKLGLSYEIVGSGSSVVNQVPASGSKMSVKNGKVILYTEAEAEKLTAVVPKVIGLTAQAANTLLTDAGFNVKIEGATGSPDSIVVSQSLAVGTVTEKGTVITIDMRHMDATD